MWSSASGIALPEMLASGTGSTLLVLLEAVQLWGLANPLQHCLPHGLVLQLCSWRHLLGGELGFL